MLQIKLDFVDCENIETLLDEINLEKKISSNLSAKSCSILFQLISEIKTHFRDQ